MQSVTQRFLASLFVLSLASGAHAASLKIVTSVAPITNIVRNVGGQHVEVNGIVPEGVNSHTFEPAPSDARILAAADLIIMNGLHLELPTIKLAEKLRKKESPIVQLGDLSIRREEWRFDFSFPASGGHPNPHLWPNVALAMRYAELTRDILMQRDPAHASDYLANTTAYLARLSKLDAAIFDCVASIPAASRKLLTYHDSYAYFARRYGMTVIGAIQPSDFSEPTPREIIRIIEQLKAEKIPAVFGSEVFPSKVLKQIARDAGARYIDELADDDLPGEAGDPNHTYAGMMKRNIEIITGALGGNAACTRGIETGNL